MGDFQQFVNGLDWSVLTDALISIIPALVCITIHEMCHGIAAYLLGDDTARSQGRLSLNPIRHIDPIGLLMLAVFKFGWAKPVSVDMRRFRNPKAGMALTALAGPVSNFLLACVLLFLRGILASALYGYGFGTTVINLLEMTAYLSVCLGLFNLIPIPPLDGSKVLFALLPSSAYMKLMRYEKFGMILLVLIMVSGYISRPLGIASGYVYSKLYACALGGYALTRLF